MGLAYARHVSDRPRSHQHETSSPHGPDHPHDHGPDADHVHAAHDHDLEGGHGSDAHGHAHPTGRLAGMVAAVVGHSHDPANSLDPALAGDKRGIRAVQVSLVALGVTAVLQLGVVLISGSVALLADTVHNFSDALTAVPLWIAFAIGGRAATRSYTFGYRRAEDLAGLFVLAMILFSALFAGWESINRLINPQPITNIPAIIARDHRLPRQRARRAIPDQSRQGHRERGPRRGRLSRAHRRADVTRGRRRRDRRLPWLPACRPAGGVLIAGVILVLLRSATAQMVGRLMDSVQPEMVDEVERITRDTPGVVEVE